MSLRVEQLHLTESLTRLGGVETLVRQLLTGGTGSHAAALLDAPETGIEKGVGLRAGKHAGAFLVRRAARVRFTHARHLVFHNFSGMMMLSGSIPHERKSLFLHTNSPDVFALLPERLPYLDTILVSGSDLENELRAKFPNLCVPVTAVEYPLDERYFSIPERALGQSLVLGYSGRLEFEQKQVLRLVDLCRALAAHAVPFTLEIAGAGNAMEELRRQLPGANCRFLGALNAAGLCEAYQRWDFLVCTSDYETGPLVAMEAMAAGVIPVLPGIPCQATALVADLDFPLYPRGDMAAACLIIRNLATDPSAGDLISKLKAKVAGRRLDRFVAKIDSVLAESAARPALGSTPPVPRGFAEFLPFSLRRSGNTYLR
jgi:glycosyltransferase involved in cell wall biosynthesis